ncbi:unnamed protein product [Lactuca virosa]|uniref:Uncharacterized protein n=1 Tax=Lactuca virosa TaxID=75947 RepID=A0AAU9LLY7_9ASTR|nr:unnamed protein product [Lactuca virosa]
MTENYSFPSQKWSENQIRLSEFLFTNSQIRTRNIRDSHQRYVNLRTQEMFDNLVDLYARLFMTQWHHYKKFMKYSFPPPPGVSPHIYAARCYISMWFIDLYVSNREAVINLYSIAFDERYHEELTRVPHEYDSYLTLLNASIRPTHIKNALDNVQYVPIISDSINVNDSNPFGINNFTPEEDLFYGFTRIMKEGKCWCFTQLSGDPNGRPWWLFDWHSDNRVCSWFPPEDNYNLEDLTLAFILGTACTPNLGVRDVDDWQFFAEGIVPQNPNPMNYNRVIDRRFYGSYEVRTMEIQTRLGEEAQEVDREMPRFKLIDWVYHHRVVLEMDNHKRTIAHRRISLAYH